MGMQKWSDYERAAEYGPGPIAWKAGFFGAMLFIVLGSFGYCAGWFSEAATVAQREFGASALLEKYSWFKDASAALDGKRASIAVYERRFDTMRTSYANVPRPQWARDDREQINLWESEVAGIIASYNMLAADYNAQMAKFHWAFANAGDLPKGATEPLPRDYKPYDTGSR